MPSDVPQEANEAINCSKQNDTNMACILKFIQPVPTRARIQASTNEMVDAI